MDRLDLKDPQELKDLMQRLPLYRYFALCLKCSVLELMEITERVWLSIFCFFFVFACIAFFFHIAFVQLCPVFVFLAVGCIFMEWCIVRSLAKFDEDPSNATPEAVAENE